MSETVEIENLNSNATEDDVRKLCQMFGAVQVRFLHKYHENLPIILFVTAGSLSKTPRR